MKPITRPAAGRAPSRHLVTLASALAAVALVGSLAAAPARAGWTSEIPITQAWNTRPAIAMDGAGHLGVAWQESSAAPGILYATDAAGPWAPERISTGDDWSPDLVFDGAGAAHVAFVRFGAGAGLYLATNAGGTWAAQQLRADVVPWSPSMAIDGAGKLHIAYASEGFTPGIWYLTNASGTWVATRVSTGTWDSEPSLALDVYDKVHIAYARYERPSPGLLVATNASGSWSTTRVTTRPGGSDVDDFPALVIDAENVLHLTARRWASDGTELDLLYATTLPDWGVSTITLPAGAGGIGLPAIGLDESGEPEIVARLASDATEDDTLWRFTDLLGGGTSERLVAGADRSEDFPDILRDATGRLVVAHRAGWLAPGVIVHREDPDEDAMVAPSVAVDRPSVATDYWTPGVHLAFDRYANDATDGSSYATDASGSWAEETLGPTHGPPSLGITYGSVLRVAVPDRLYSSTPTGWDVHPFAVPGGSDVAIDTSHPGWQVAYLVPGAGVRVMYSSLAEEQATTDPTDEMPDIAALQTTDFLLAVIRQGLLHVIEQWWGNQTDQQIDAARAWNPAAARGVASSLMTTWVAYDRGGSTPGILLARSGSTPWSLSRLSRAYADITPGIAVGEDVPEQGGAPLFVTWARFCGGPDPGIYLATNRTGSWVTTRLASGCDLHDPSIALLGGRPVVAYADDRLGIVVVRETDAAGASAPASIGSERSSRAADDAAGGLGPASGTVGGLIPAAVASGGVEPAGTTSRGAHGSSTTTAGQLAERFTVDR